jgi:hypothetical protein
VPLPPSLPPPRCEFIVDLATLDASVAEARAAWAERDAERFAAALARGRQQLPCLGAPVDPERAARWHVVEGMAAVVAADRAAALGRLRAARAAAPAAGLSAAEAPEGSLLDLLSDEAALLGPSPRVEIDGAGLLLRVDGRPAASRPVEVPAVVQLLDGQDRPRFTVDLAPGAPLPEAPAEVTAGGARSGDGHSRAEGPAASTRGRAAPAVSLGLTGAAALGLGLWARASGAEALDPATPYAEVGPAAARGRALTVAAGAAGLLAAGAGAWLVIRW